MAKRSSGLAILLVAAVLSMPWPAQAASVEFHPEISVAGEATDNVIREPGDAGDSDLISRVSVLLPVVRGWDTGQFEFRYAPAFEWYRDTGYLDNDVHDLSMILENRQGRKGSVHFEAGLIRSVEQGGPESLTPDDLTLTAPVDRQRIHLASSYTRQVNRRWNWTGTVDAAAFRFDRITGPGAPPGPEIEDRDEWGAEIEFTRALSQRTGIGMVAEYNSFELDRSGSEDVERLGLVVHHNLGDPGDDLSLELGVSDRSGEFILPGAAESVLIESSDFFGEISLTKTLRKATWIVHAAVAPSSGGLSDVTSTDTVAGVVYQFRPNPYWNGSVSARFANQDPVDENLDTVDSTALGFYVEWRPNRKVGYRLGGDTMDQSGGPLDDISVTRGWFSLVWYPRGPQPEARRSGG